VFTRAPRLPYETGASAASVPSFAGWRLPRTRHRLSGPHKLVDTLGGESPTDARRSGVVALRLVEGLGGIAGEVGVEELGRLGDGQAEVRRVLHLGL
jgi:hypothetical protein